MDGNNFFSGNEILADFIYIFHILIIMFVLLAPFTNVPYFLVLHITFSMSLLVHWYFNSDVCSLSMIESQFRGIQYQQSFSHRIIAPIYNVSSTSWSSFCYFAVVSLSLYSVYKLYNNDKISQAWACYRRMEQELKDKDMSMTTKIKKYLACFAPVCQVKLF